MVFASDCRCEAAQFAQLFEYYAVFDANASRGAASVTAKNEPRTGHSRPLICKAWHAKGGMRNHRLFALVLLAATAGIASAAHADSCTRVGVDVICDDGRRGGARGRRHPVA